MFNFNFHRQRINEVELVEGDITLRRGKSTDASAWIELREKSKQHLTRWEPDWQPQEMKIDRVRRRLSAQFRQRHPYAYLSLFVFRNEDDALVGGINLSNIRYGAVCSAQIGYWIGSPYIRHGYGLSAVRATLRYGFGLLGLNRIEAACQPDNVASRQLLLRAGFEEEGHAKEYLLINGAWRDHCLFAARGSTY